MATEYIQLQQGIEQDFSLDYNNINYTFQLRFDDYNEQWFLNISNLVTSETLITGLYLLIDNNVLSQLKYLGLGGLVLADTDPTSTTALDIQNDLGTRLKLYRNVSA